MSTKQNKFYETLRQTQANTFSDGLNMDLHPLTTPNTILTDCVNGTMITYNDNEFVLQNERGNSKIKIEDTEHVKLSEGFIPVGMKEHNGILYIVSHNPQTKQSEIGTYPSPNKIQEHGVNLVFEGNGEIKSNYTVFDQNIKYYDFNTIVTNQDNYTFSSSHNPLVVLEHFILNKTGEVTKTKLIGKDGTETYRFTHEGEGTLGYRYRPYYLSSITPSIIHSKGGSDAQLVIEATSDDKELYEVLKTQDDIKFKYDIIIEFINGENKLEFNSVSLDIDKWDYTFNLTNVSKLPLPFENKFTIKNGDGTIECEYNYRTGELIANNIDDNTSTNYKEVNFNITPRIYTRNDNYIVYNNLIADYKTTVDVVFKQESWFTTFKYKPQDESSDKLSILATLDLSRFDIDWQTNVETVNEASYKLYEIDKYGNIKGKYVNKPFTVYKSPLFDVVDSKLDMKSHDLVFNDKQYNFSLSDIETLIPIQYSNITTAQCMNLTSENKARYVRYDKINEKTYNVVLLNANYEELSSTNIYSDIMCSEDMKKMIDEYFDKTNGKVNYTINDVPFEYNKVYLLELTFPINGKINKASFIVVTAQSMFNLYSADILNQRMDEILLSIWFEPNVHIEYNTLHNDYRNASSFVNNLIDVEKIKNMPTDDNGEAAKKYAMQFFLKYNQLFTNPNDNEIPAIGEQFDCTAFIKNKSDFDCVIEYNGSISINERSIEKNIINTLSLVTDKQDIIQQTSERKYLYDIFNNVKKVDVKSEGAYNIGGSGLIWGKFGSLIKLSNPDGIYITWMPAFDFDDNYIDNTYLLSTYEYNIKKRSGRCNLTSGGDKYKCYKPSKNEEILYHTEFYNNLFGVSTMLMKNVGLSNGFNYGEVKENNNHVSYSGNNKKIWLHSKFSNKNTYVLLGVDALNSSEENSLLACNVLRKHGYYTIPCNRQIYQYVFKTVDKKISISNIKTEDMKTPIKIYPGQCMAIFNDYSSYNIQNWNNLHILNLTSNYNIGEFKISYTLPEDFNINYKYFLETLGTLINSHFLDSSILNEQINNTIIKFDNSENLFIDDVSKINTMDRNYNNSFRDMNMPELMYDKDNNLIYYILKSNVIDQFEYSGGDCVEPLNWNYSIPFNGNDGFWPDGSLDNIQNLNDYHSLLFYKLTTYNGEQQSQDSN